jgi:VanZ family protein
MQIRILEPLISIALMLIIFLASSEPTAGPSHFNLAEKIVRKSGHFIGYFLLALSYYHTLGGKPNKRWVAWFIALLYAVTDEFHQSFVPGRDASIWDVLIFDNLGALLGSWLGVRWTKKDDRPKTKTKQEEEPAISD